MDSFQTSVCDRARKEVVIGIALLLITMGAFVLFFGQNYINSRTILAKYLQGTGPERAVYNLIFAVFMYGSFTYQVSRLAFFWNVRARVKAAQESLARFAAVGVSEAPAIEILVPSYKEESHVIWQTLMSAALLDYPNRRITLLLDDPPLPNSTADRDLLTRARAQAQIVADQLSPLASKFAASARNFHAVDRAATDHQVAANEAASLYGAAADFLRTLAGQVRRGELGGSNDHTRTFFVERILLAPAAEHERRAAQLVEKPVSWDDLAKEFDRLAYLFKVSLNTFERKKYVNLSHAATKAANLNAYISLMGRRFAVTATEEGNFLGELSEGDAEFGSAMSLSDAEFVVILDADSFLLPDYATCMISALQAPDSKHIAVMQTPYTSVPNTPHRIERAVAATNDIYYYVTEGMSFARAGSWIGAAAVIRKQALRDIATYENERGYVIPIYIQDKTVIEDTGATIDLALQGWRVMNYPARLSFSATPPDFGALVVQRRRWANGGLIILPSVFRYLSTLRFSMKNVLEGLLRVHYLIMPACISISMLLMLLYPFDFKRVSSWIYITLPPYLYLVCRDLAQSGYRRVDILKAYSLFVILLPVVLSGVKNSALQIIYGKRTSFSRTPKIEERTATPAPILLAIIGLFAWSIATAYKDFTLKHELHAVFAVSNALALGYGMIALIGLKEMAQDLLLSAQPIFAWLRTPLSGQTNSADAATAVVSAPPLQPATSQTTGTGGNPDTPAPAADPVASRRTGTLLQSGSATFVRTRLHSTPPPRTAREPSPLSRMSARRKR